MRKDRTHWVQLIVVGMVPAVVWTCLSGCGTRTGEDDAETPEMNVTVSKATTYFTGPLNKDGTVNYVAAYNSLNGKGVTRDNNAAVLLLRAIGPNTTRYGANDSKVDPIEGKILELLGMGPWPEKGGYFVNAGDYAGKVFPEDPDGDQAAAFTERIFKSWEKLTAGAAAAQSKDHPEYAKWLESNRGPLQLVTAASKRPRFFIPVVSGSDPPSILGNLPGPVEPAGQCVGLAMTLVGRAMLAAGDGDIDRALADLLTVHRLARLLGEDLSMYRFLIGMSPDRMAYDGDSALIAGGKLSASQAREYSKQLQQLKPLSALADVIDVGERMQKLEFWMMSGRRGLPVFEKDGKTRMPVDVDWNLLLTTYNQLLDECVKALRRPTLVQAKAALQKIRKQIADEGLVDAEAVGLDMSNHDGTPAAVEHIFTRFQKAVGRIGAENVKELSRAFAQDEAYPKQQFDMVLELRYETRAKADLTHIALAMIAYKADKAQYPETLEALSPKYLKTAPSDCFTGKPLKYARKGDGYVLYSVGGNLKDDRGDPEEHHDHHDHHDHDGHDDCDDIVIRIDR